MVPWTDIALVAETAVASAAGWFAWRESHSDRGDKKSQDQIDKTIAPLDSRVTLLEQHFKDALERNRELTAAAIAKEIRPLAEDVGILKTKMEVFWNNAAFGAAKILHQPDPRRKMVDDLLESFMEGTLTAEEETRLKKYLVKIRDWEPQQGEYVHVEVNPGEIVTFPVRDGEQGPAAILLATMDHVITTPRS